MIPLKVSDLKQYAYCPRVVYYQYLMPVEKKTTFKMDYGKIEEARIDKLESRRKLKRYGISEGERIFHHWISSQRLGLSGKLDLLIKTEKEYFPVDFKFTDGKPQRNHVYQLCGYALILDDVHQTKVTKGFVYLIPKDDAVIFELSDPLKQDAVKMINDIREMIGTERMPPVVENRNKCYDCEYRNYCGDVF
ncbi:MAG: CRISPR-associated protein Cas4 [Nitrospirae bacterium]|nr:CRISPR-associated protein Cas4 [Nitrospirota bacterium]